MAPKVSVIIPNYNHANHLKQRIESVLDQTYRDFEIIILDDCSTDSSKEVITGYVGHPLVKEIIFNEKNSGTPFKQWQRGLELAKGDWIWFAESDDYADERFLEILIAAIGDRQNIGLAYCDSKIVDDDLVSERTFADIKNQRFATNRWSENYFNTGASEIEEYLLPGGTINNSSAVLFNKRIMQEANPFDFTFRYIGDKYAFIKVLAKSDVVYVKDSLNYFRYPFNTKHVDKFVFYFYEQFLVFDWVYKNVNVSNRKLFFKGFYANTRNSLFRDWGSTKLSIYKKLFMLNRFLLLKNIFHNFHQSIRSVFERTKQAQ